jgi:hypothetical protein
MRSSSISPAPPAEKGARNMDAVRQLVDYIKRMQTAQADILQKADKSIEFQKSLNGVFFKLVPTLEVIQKALEERKGMNLDSGILPKLCNDLR